MAEREPQPRPGDYRFSRPVGDEPIEIRRYVNALRLDRRLVVLLVGIATALTFAISLTQEMKYQASSRIVFEELEGLLQRRDVESVKRDLATLRTLVETPAVLDQAAKRLPGLSGGEINEKVSISVDPNANIITVVATDTNPRRAAALANAVATVFIAKRRDRERAQLRIARAALLQQLDRIESSTGASTQAEALRTRVNDLGVLIAGAGSELQIAERALPPTSPYSPRPFRNALIALFASTFLAVLLVFAREQMRPHISSARELSRLLELPILARVPWIRRRDRRSGIVTGGEHDAYQTLQAALRFRARSASQSVVLVTSAVHSEGKSRVTAGLGVALAQSGAPTLLISADLRSSALHEFFGTSPKTGLAEILASDGRDREVLRATIDGATSSVRPRLDIIASSTKRVDAVELLSSATLDALFEELAHLEYEYIFIDAPPLLGIADSRLLARGVDSILVVGRPDRLTAELALDLHEALGTLEPPVLGLVVVGADGEHPVYGEREGSVGSDEERSVDDEAEASTRESATAGKRTWA